jgi:hypothetical protein
MTVIPLDRQNHEAVQALLPWYLTRRLEPGELALVERHLALCARCRADLAFERRLRDAMAALPSGDQAEQGLARLRPRLQARPWHRRWRRALAATALVATPLLFLATGPSYRALGPVAAPANVVVKLRPGVAPQDAAQHWPEGAALVGTTVTEGWLLHVPPAQRAQALARLRADPAVLLAEPLDSAGAPR